MKLMNWNLFEIHALPNDALAKVQLPPYVTGFEAPNSLSKMNIIYSILF